MNKASHITPWLLHVNLLLVSYLISNSSDCSAIISTQLACVLRIIMRQFSERGGQYEIRRMSGANSVQHNSDELQKGDSSNTYKDESSFPLSVWLTLSVNVSVALPFLEPHIFIIMVPSTFLILTSIALGINATVVDPHHQSPANPFTLGFFDTPEIRGPINLKVEGKVNFANSYLWETY